MRYLMILLLPLTITLANPIFSAYITEIQVSPDSLERIEIFNPNDSALPLSNSQIITSAGIAFVNDSTFIPAEGYLVIDSTNTHGVFSLNDESDSIFLYGYYSVIEGTYKYPVLPAGYGHGPTPPFYGSVAFYVSYDQIEYSNWYVDSTPTFGIENDDWSSISGGVLDQDSNPTVFHEILATGPMGISGYINLVGQPYNLRGLGAGKYWVQARYRTNWYAYPESIELGYNEHLTGYDIIFPFVEVQEKIGKENTIPMTMKSQIYDVLGRKVESKTKISKGIYFKRTETGIKKFVIAH